MACDYCLNTKGLEETWAHCPMCGGRLDVVRFVNMLKDICEEAMERVRNAVHDENGNPMEMDSTLDMSARFDTPTFDTLKFDPENVDISKELNWLKLQSDAERIMNVENSYGMQYLREKWEKFNEQYIDEDEE